LIPKAISLTPPTCCCTRGLPVQPAVADFIENEQAAALAQMSHLPAYAIFRLRLHQTVEQIGQGDEVNTVAVTDGFHPQRDRQMGLAHSRRPEQHGILVTLQKEQTRQLTDRLFVDGGREFKVKLFQPFEVWKARQLRAHFNVPLLAGVGFALQHLFQKVAVGQVLLDGGGAFSAPTLVPSDGSRPSSTGSSDRWRCLCRCFPARKPG